MSIIFSLLGEWNKEHCDYVDKRFNQMDVKKFGIEKGL